MTAQKIVRTKYDYNTLINKFLTGSIISGADIAAWVLDQDPGMTRKAAYASVPPVLTALSEVLPIYEPEPRKYKVLTDKDIKDWEDVKKNGSK